MLWSEKYRPTTIATMCSPGSAQRLKTWLINWARAGPSGPTAEESSHLKRAALLSGPPGVGKTTAVYVVARELDYEVIEFNASDHRSAKSLRETVADLIDNRVFRTAPAKSSSGTGANSFFALGNSVGAARPAPISTNGTSFLMPDGALTMRNKFILLMDEVDGCDRGGATEIIQFIKTSKCPIICTCNDRWVPKLRSLCNHVEDIRFSRPASNEVARFLITNVLNREGVTVPENLLQDVVRQGGNDIRAVLNNLQIWTRRDKNMSSQKLASAALSASKNLDIGLFEAADKFFNGAAKSSDGGGGAPSSFSFTIEEQMRLYYDSELIDLFVAENYLNFRPDRKDWMRQAAIASASISTADVIQRQIFSEQSWLAGSAAAFRASVYPCAAVRGQFTPLTQGANNYQFSMANQRTIRFPTWLGFNSTAGKFRRMSTLMHKQGQDPVDGFGVGSGAEFCMEYAPVLSARLAEPVAVAAANEKNIKESLGAAGAASQSQALSAYDIFESFGSGAMESGNNNNIPTPLNDADAKKKEKEDKAAKAAAAEKTKAAVAESIKMMDTYHMQREDWDNLVELIEFKHMVEVSPFAGKLNFVKHVPAVTKAAITREFNKGAHFERGGAKAVAAKGNFDTQRLEGEDEDDDDENSNGSDNDDNDDGNKKAKGKRAAPGGKKGPAAKPSAKAASAAAAGAAAAAAPAKGKGKGKGKKVAAGGDAVPKSKPAAKGGVRRDRQD